MKRFTVYLGLGSNLGEREKILNRAAGALKTVRETTVVWTSSVYETDPYGKKEQPKFLNAVLQLETGLQPQELLLETRNIEANIGRTHTERWGPREIDIDILLYEGLVFEDQNIRVPHPELDKRKFVLVPLREIAPNCVHPVSGMTIAELSTDCPDTTRVVRSSHHIIL